MKSVDTQIFDLNLSAVRDYDNARPVLNGVMLE